MKLSLGSLLPGSDRGWKSMYRVCALQACQSTLLMRSVQGRGGIGMGGQWYCGTDCFAAAARKRLTALMGDGAMEMPHRPRLSVGLAMLSRGYLTDDQLRHATAESRSRGEELGATLLRLRLATERQLAAARAAQWGYPVLGQEYAGQAVRADIPATLLRTYATAPLHYSATARRLLLGFVYRVEHSLLNALEAITECRPDACFITPTEFREQMGRLTSARECEEVVFEESMAIGHMAKNVAGFAMEISASQAQLVRCRDYAWARLTGRRRTIDVLFRVTNAIEAEGPRYQARANFRRA